MHARSTVFVTFLAVGLAGCVTESEPPPPPSVVEGRGDARSPLLCEAYQLDGLDPAPGPRVERRAPDAPDDTTSVDWTTESGCHLASFSGHSGRTLVCPVGGSALSPLDGDLLPGASDPPATGGVAASESVTYELVEVDGQLWLYAVDAVTGERIDRVCLVRDA